MEENYKPFSKEWENMLMRKKKSEIIRLFKSVAKERNELREEILLDVMGNLPLQKRFKIYEKAINEIQDFLEYRYEKHDGLEIRTEIMKSIDAITEQLRAT